MSTSKRKIFVQYVGISDEDGKLVEAKVNTVSEQIMIDDNEITICGLPDAVTRMKIWIQAAGRKDDYEELLRPFFYPTKSGKPIQFPLIGEEIWSITLKK
jgi:hypothetical protein